MSSTSSSPRQTGPSCGRSPASGHATKTVRVGAGSAHTSWSPSGRADSLRCHRVRRSGRHRQRRLGLVAGTFRPPDGPEILVEPDSRPGSPCASWMREGTDAGSDPGTLVGDCHADIRRVPLVARRDHDRLRARLEDGKDESHVFVMNPDGTDIRRLPNETGGWFEHDLVWSPDSKQIAFNRWRQDGDRDRDIRADRDRLGRRRTSHRRGTGAGLRRGRVRLVTRRDELVSIPATVACNGPYADAAPGRRSSTRDGSGRAGRAGVGGRSLAGNASREWHPTAGADRAASQDKKEPRVVGPGVQGVCGLVAGRGFEPLTFGL